MEAEGAFPGGKLRGAEVHRPMARGGMGGVWRPLNIVRSRGGRGLLVREDLDVGQSGGVIDRDVHRIRPFALPADAGNVCAPEAAVVASAGAVALAGAALDPPDRLAITMYGSPHLAERAHSARRLQTEPSELHEPDPFQDS